MIGTEDDTDDEHISAKVKVSLKQIEFNTIASSFAGLAQNLSTYHRWGNVIPVLDGLMIES